MRRKTAMARGIVLVALVLAGWGCGDSLNKPPMGKVTGKVTYKGAPITNGTVSFFPVEGKGAKGDYVAIGEINSDGTFELTTFDTGDGAVTGQHKAIVKIPPPPGEVDITTSNSDAAIRAHEKRRATGPPEKYSDPEKTPLKYTVNAGKNNFDIELKD